MDSTTRLYLFGDQTFDVSANVKSMMQHRGNPLLENFLSKAYEVVRKEVYSLPPQVRDDLPRLSSLDDFLLRKQSGARSVALDMAATITYQLGMFIRYVDLPTSTCMH